MERGRTAHPLWSAWRLFAARSSRGAHEGSAAGDQAIPDWLRLLLPGVIASGYARVTHLSCLQVLIARLLARTQATDRADDERDVPFGAMRPETIVQINSAISFAIILTAMSLGIRTAISATALRNLRKPACFCVKLSGLPLPKGQDLAVRFLLRRVSFHATISNPQAGGGSARAQPSTGRQGAARQPGAGHRAGHGQRTGARGGSRQTRGTDITEGARMRVKQAQADGRAPPAPVSASGVPSRPVRTPPPT